jgi:hypothetical protein
MTAHPQSSRDVGWAVDEVEQRGLVRGSPPAATDGTWRRWGWSLETAHEALKLGAGEATAPADMYGLQLSSLDEPVDGRASDPQHPSGFLRRQQKCITGQQLLERLRVTHVGNSGGGGSCESPVPLRRDVERPPPGTGEVLDE